ncbi:MAG: glycosyltransferase [bacterium]|nr:glycosyltransferase [bacterium]
MRVLILTSTPPYPAHQGGALRVNGIVRGLHQHGHDVTLLCFVEDDNPARYAPLYAYCSRIETEPMPIRSRAQRLGQLAFSPHPDIAGRLDSATMRDHLARIVREDDFDLIQFEGLEMAIYLPFAAELKRQGHTRARLIYDSFNAEAALQRLIASVERQQPRRLPMAAYSHIQAVRIDRFERDICQQADAVIAVSHEDADLLRPNRADHCIHVLPSGIDADAYAQHPQKLDLGKHVLVFTGKMDYRPNVDAMLWFANGILPLIREHHPDTRLFIVGQKPHSSLDSLRAKPGIEITGWVPDVPPYLHAASVYVAPLRMGSGTRLKLLEAMASGCAVAATNTAASGLNDQVRETLCIADDEQAMAHAVLTLLDHPAARQTMGARLRDLVRHAYDWQALTPALLAIYREIGLG